MVDRNKKEIKEELVIEKGQEIKRVVQGGQGE